MSACEDGGLWILTKVRARNMLIYVLSFAFVLCAKHCYVRFVWMNRFQEQKNVFGDRVQCTSFHLVLLSAGSITEQDIQCVVDFS